jgi:class 3 adenylate cyclase
MLKALKDYNDTCNSNFQARIGINSGSVVAGVLGTAQVWSRVQRATFLRHECSLQSIVEL